MVNSFDRFVIQLRSFLKMIKDTEKTLIEESKKIDLSVMTSIIFDRKFLEYEIEHKMKELEEDDNGINNKIMKLSTILIERNKIARKLYDVIDVDEDEHNDIRIKSSSGILPFFLSVSADNSYNSIYQLDELLFQSLSISLCSAFENFASEILKDFYFKYHKGDLVDAKTISFKSMCDFESIDEVRRYLIDIQLEETFRQSFCDWIKIIERCTGFCSEFSEAKDLISEINELFLRRNLYVHANGIVNQYYLQKVDRKYADSLKTGEKLLITKEYLVNKIKRVENLGWFILYSYLGKHSEDKEEWFIPINNKLVTDISSDNEAIPTIFKKAKDDKTLGQSCNVLASINFYLYYYENGRLDEVKKELEKFDVSVYSIEYKMAKSILLDKDNKHELIKQYFDSLTDEGDFLSCFEWPLMRKVRNEEPSKSYFESKINAIFSVQNDEEVLEEIG